MTISQLLQELYSLDPSSPQIPRLLDDLIRRDEEEQYLSSLRGSELVRLVDFLDDVRTPPPPALQSLNRLCRPSVPFPPQTRFTDNVCANYKPSVVTT